MGRTTSKPTRRVYRQLLVCPDHGLSPFLWNKVSGGVVADGAYYYGHEPLSRELWEAFAEWVRSFSAAAYTEAGFPESWDWDAFHQTGRALARRLQQEVGPDCQVFYAAPEESPSAGQWPEVVT